MGPTKKNTNAFWPENEASSPIHISNSINWSFIVISMAKDLWFASASLYFKWGASHQQYSKISAIWYRMCGRNAEKPIFSLFAHTPCDFHLHIAQSIKNHKNPLPKIKHAVAVLGLSSSFCACRLRRLTINFIVVIFYYILLLFDNIH